jgi:hypothetical protein
VSAHAVAPPPTSTTTTMATMTGQRRTARSTRDTSDSACLSLAGGGDVRPIPRPDDASLLVGPECQVMSTWEKPVRVRAAGVTVG